MKPRGFTLLELLVAISVFSVLSVVAYGGLFSVLETRARVEVRMDSLDSLQMAFLWLGRDLDQLAPREIRDQNGVPRQAFMIEEAGRVLEFSRGGRANPGHWPRSALQRVAYELREGELIRKAWAVLDQAQDSEPQESVLLTGVTDWRMRFLDGENQWQVFWPVEKDAVASLPRAVEMIVVTEQWGEIPRVFELPDSASLHLVGPAS